jgi:hypothetical protein
MDFDKYEQTWGSDTQIKTVGKFVPDLGKEKKEEQEEIIKFDDLSYSKRFNELLAYVNEVSMLINKKFKKKISKINYCDKNSNFFNRNKHLYFFIKEIEKYWIKIKKPRFAVRKILFNFSEKVYIKQFNSIISYIKSLENNP